MFQRINGNPFINEITGINPSMPGFSATKRLNSCFGNGYASNPIQNKKKSDKQYVFEKLDTIKYKELKAEIEDILKGGTPSQDFIDMILEHYEKKQAEFEEAWARYQEAKGEQASLKKIFETTAKRYKDSDSNYEQSLVKNAKNKYKNSELDADVLLSIASYLAHRAV